MKKRTAMLGLAAAKPMEHRTSFFTALLADGRPFFTVTGTALCASGGFAIFQSWTGHCCRTILRPLEDRTAH